MPSRLTHEEVAAIAALAHLALDADEMDLFTRQLGDILEYVDQLRQVDTTGVAPTASVLTQHHADRADEIRPSLDLGDGLANAPDPAPEAGMFRVPRVIG